MYQTVAFYEDASSFPVPLLLSPQILFALQPIPLQPHELLIVLQPTLLGRFWLTDAMAMVSSTVSGLLAGIQT